VSFEQGVWLALAIALGVVLLIIAVNAFRK